MQPKNHCAYIQLKGRLRCGIYSLKIGKQDFMEDQSMVSSLGEHNGSPHRVEEVKPETVLLEISSSKTFY